ncbi:anti-sigma factor antagonist [Streptosporangium violaceochromogenes]|nr:anti-sigma factor antagonist [Streptosporangium violaceochromogenes]
MDLSTHTHSRWVICSVAGEVDIFTAPAVREHLLAALDGPGRGILLDLSAVTFMDASGLRVLISIKREVEERQRTLCLLAPTPAIRRLLKAGGLSGHFCVKAGPVTAERTEPVLGAA